MRQFLAVGNLCLDKTPTGLTLGGASAYAAITAQNLGCQTSVVTAVGPNFDRRHPLLKDVEIEYFDSKETTVFHNTYDEKGNRQQVILGLADRLGKASIPADFQRPDIVYLCPIADEVDANVAEVFSSSLIGVTPQGWMRAWDENGKVLAKPWDCADEILSKADVLVLSDEDIAARPEDLDRFIKNTPVVVLTRGYRGAQLFEGGRVYEAPAYQVSALDPTGAGDVFATSFLVWYHRSGSAMEAMNFANCVASFSVESPGMEGIPSFKTVSNRLETGRTKVLENAPI